MDRLLEIRDLVKEFHGRGLIGGHRRTFRAVDRVSFDVERKTIFGLVGESGCGKTTLSRAALYLDPPSAGSVRVDGTTLGELSPRELRSFRRRMQIVFQDPNGALNPKLRVRDSMEEGLINLGMPAHKRRLTVEATLELVGIPPAHASRHPHEFSGGQKQRLVVARALTMEPELLILDEPVSNLDVSIQAQIINLLLDIKEKLSLTYLFISHDLNLVAYLSDRIGVMYRGRIVEMGPTERIMAEPAHPYTLKLFSSSPSYGKDSFRGPVEARAAQAGPAAAGAAVAPPTPGCPYASRCGYPDGACQAQEPELRDIGGGHQVACFKVGPRAGGGG